MIRGLWLIFILMAVPFFLAAAPLPDLGPLLTKSEQKDSLQELHSLIWKTLSPETLQIEPHQTAPYLKDQGAKLTYQDGDGKVLIAFDWFYSEMNPFNLDTDHPARAAEFLQSQLLQMTERAQSKRNKTRSEEEKSKKPLANVENVRSLMMSREWKEKLTSFLKNGRLLELKIDAANLGAETLAVFSLLKERTRLPEAFLEAYPEETYERQKVSQFFQISRRFAENDFHFKHESSVDSITLDSQSLSFQRLSTGVTTFYWRPGERQLRLVSEMWADAIPEDEPGKQWLRSILPILYPGQSITSIPIEYEDGTGGLNETCAKILGTLTP